VVMMDAKLVAFRSYIVKSKMAQPDITTKTSELKLVFERMDGMAAAKNITNNPKLYLSFDRGILWQAVVKNPWCKEGEVVVGWIVAGPLDGVVGSSVAERREADRKALETELKKKEEERRKWQSRAQKHLDDYASYKAYVKTNYGPRLTAEEKQKQLGEGTSKLAKEEGAPDARAESAGISAFHDFCNQMDAFITQNPEYADNQPAKYADWPTSRFILKTIKRSESASWFMVDLMAEHFTGPDDASKIINMWMDFFESGREGIVHGAARSAFTSLEKLKVFAKEAKELLSTYPKKAFNKVSSYGSAARVKFQKGYENVKDRVHILKQKAKPKAGFSNFFAKMWAPFKRGANGVRRLWTNVLEGDTDLKGKIMKGVACVTFLPVVSIAAFAVNFWKKDPAGDHNEGEQEVVDEEEQERESARAYNRAQTASRLRSSAASMYSNKSEEVETPKYFEA